MLLLMQAGYSGIADYDDNDTDDDDDDGSHEGLVIKKLSMRI